jgi:hypothetical protein
VAAARRAAAGDGVAGDGCDPADSIAVSACEAFFSVCARKVCLHFLIWFVNMDFFGKT